MTKLVIGIRGTPPLSIKGFLMVFLTIRNFLSRWVKILTHLNLFKKVDESGYSHDQRVFTLMVHLLNPTLRNRICDDFN